MLHTPTKPLAARSVIASLLLPLRPPRLPGRRLVQAGRLFNIEEGTIRVALSRMVAAGELVAEGGDYELAGKLLERQGRQVQARAPRLRRWSGGWLVAIVPAGRRDADARSELRAAAAALRFASLREGVWARPDNLDQGGQARSMQTLEEQCFVLRSRLDDPEPLVRQLWDLEGWAEMAAAYRTELLPFAKHLEAHDTDALEPAFRLAASVVRHLMADPLLPDALLPDGWPGPALREDLDRFELAFRSLFAEFLGRG